MSISVAAEGKAAFALRGHNPDVLTCIANLSNDEVFTPPELANQMLDTVEQAWAESNGGASIWADPNVTFLDPFTKSGVFLREIVSRLTVGLESAIPELKSRVDHILTKQVFGIGITQLTALLARRSVYCSKDATGKHSIAKGFDRDWGNIWFERTEHTWVGGRPNHELLDAEGNPTMVGRRCRFCGAAESEYLRDSGLESHAYAFIHTDDIKARVDELFGANMQFDVIIGNPPYQLDDGGFGSSAAPIYQLFVEQAKTLGPRMLSMVVPARWYAGGKGLNEFRATMLQDARMRVLDDYPNTGDVFPGVNNRGGICTFLWDASYDGEVLVRTHEGGVVTSEASRSLLEPGMNTFIRYNEGLEILRKVIGVESGETRSPTLPDDRRFSALVSSRKPFGLPTNFLGREDWLAGDLKVYRNGGVSYTTRQAVTAGHDLVDEVKLFVPYASPGSDEYPHLVLSRPIVAGPGEIATETYLAIGPFENESEARHAAGYMGTQFFRFMLTLLRMSQHVTRSVYAFAPLQDFSRAWTDDDLATEYGLTERDRSFMDRFVKPVAWKGAYE
ncbi:Eco57I restriction-modification methylase domain-containing protein [Microbacterium alcoholitolerans]|uniref:Eco57I restriction-modification methylase domain-containing protein n=1 Tax=unclassified Microbacterium TaxID=2609290 RepID=UPI003D16D8E9